VVPGVENGVFVGPTLLKITNNMTIAHDEVFGPVLGIITCDTLDQAIDMIHGNPHGNAASIFTSSGRAAREFKYRVFCGNIGINIGIAAPLATFPFGGMKDSFFGDLHGQGRDGIEFFTDRKVVITRCSNGQPTRALPCFFIKPKPDAVGASGGIMETDYGIGDFWSG
jgi:malonate-semialdehyde dehydrogenase (acetylating)/methylmalonate-semialdehyde dehydrogenase